MIDGFAALLSFMPQHSFGIVVLTNRFGHNPVLVILSYAVYDHLLGLEPAFWIDRFPSTEGSSRGADRWIVSKKQRTLRR